MKNFKNLKICSGCNLPKPIWKSVGKKDKYCKNCWYDIEKPKAISPVSEKKKEEISTYTKLRSAFLFLKSHCEAKLIGCTGAATDIHHKKGRIGDNYLAIGTWLAVCRNCHSWIELNPEEAKELGLSESRLNNEE